MLKYKGKFRVLYEVDKNNKIGNFTYLPCGIKKGSTIVRHNRKTLSAYIPSTELINKLLAKYGDMFTLFQNGDGEGTLLFEESNIDKMASILKIQTKGKNKNPNPTIKRKVTISDERRKILSEKMKSMTSSNINRVSLQKGG